MLIWADVSLVAGGGMHRTHIDRKFCEEEYEVSVVSSMEKYGQFRYI